MTLAKQDFQRKIVYCKNTWRILQTSTTGTSLL